MLRFGTDGIRGDAERQLTSELVVALGRAAAAVLGTDRRFLIGRDTRASGPRIARELAAGLRSAGADVLPLGVLPTPGVAFCGELRAAPAAMVSASHNRWTDNGIKLFAPGGRKLDDGQEDAIEAALEAAIVDPVACEVDGADAGPDDGAPATHEYLQHLAGVLDGRSLSGVRLVLDCANGASSTVAPFVFRALGAHVDVLAAEPNGRNINDECGSNHPDGLQQAVVAHGADLGLAFDGDADRCVAVAADGALVDGDQILVALALDLAARGRLRDDAVVVTVMSNLGLRRALAGHGIRVVDTPVGDRHVLAALEANGWVLGGEQSGHIVVRDLATTGDGTLTGLLVADLVARTGRPLAELAGQMTRCPQVLENVRVEPGFDLAGARALWAEVGALEAELGERGRVLVRASGTEPIVRLMVEAPTDAEATTAVARLRRTLA